MVLTWRISSLGVSHWLKGTCQSNPPEGVFQWSSQCSLGACGGKIRSVKTNVLTLRFSEVKVLHPEVYLTLSVSNTMYLNY